jgi:hypothetical protein
MKISLSVLLLAFLCPSTHAAPTTPGGTYRREMVRLVDDPAAIGSWRSLGRSAGGGPFPKGYLRPDSKHSWRKGKFALNPGAMPAVTFPGEQSKDLQPFYLRATIRSKQARQYALEFRPEGKSVVKEVEAWLNGKSIGKSDRLRFALNLQAGPNDLLVRMRIATPRYTFRLACDSCSRRRHARPED